MGRAPAAIRAGASLFCGSAAPKREFDGGDINGGERVDERAGGGFDLAGDELSGNDVVGILSRATGRPFTYFQVPQEVIRERMGEDAAIMYEFFDRVGFAVDRAALRREFPDVAFHDFESWVKAQDGKALLRGGLK